MTTQRKPARRAYAAADAPWFPVDATAMPRAPFATAVDTMQ
jgi:hypothetical protein